MRRRSGWTRRSPAALILLVIGVTGCISGFPTTRHAASSAVCPAAGEMPAGGFLVEVQVANAKQTPTCVRVHFDGKLVASGVLRGETPGLHSNPSEVSRFGWARRDVVVRFEDTSTGLTHEEAVRLDEGKTTWVVAWVSETSVTVRTYASEPRWA